jgi:SLAP domain-containing protein
VCYTLVLHPKWKDAISDKDLEIFRLLEQKISDLEKNVIHFIGAKVARNYRKDILATVLIVNATEKGFTPNDTWLTYKESGYLVAKQDFTVETLLVEPNTITPWTFIFKGNSFIRDPQLKNWKVTC